MIGYLLGIGLVAVAVSAPTVGILCQYVQKRSLNSIAFLMVAISMIVFGPSSLLGLPE